MGKVIGIDLGTTYSCVSYLDDFGTIQIADNVEGEQTTPSIVYFGADGNVVGSTARNEAVDNPECLVERVKNHMGNPDYRFVANGTEYSAAAVSTVILKKLIADAETAIGEEIDGAIITCPAYFGDSERNATKVAGENVTLSNGNPLNVMMIVDEPVAAAIAYANSKKEDMSKTVLIYDLGGGTFDCTIMKINIVNGVRTTEVITSGGNHQLGGKDWDAEMTNLIVNKFCDSTGNDPDGMKNDPGAAVMLSEESEKTKKLLTNKPTASARILYNGAQERIEITREEFEDATSMLLDQTIFLVNDMFDKKGMSVISDIDEIILVGGSTYMPQVRSRLENEYNKPISSYEPNKAVAMGAAVLADELAKNPVPVVNPVDDTSNAPDFGAGSLSQVTPGGVILKCTKSYGIRFYQNGEEKVLNLVMKDDPKPTVGHSSDHMPGLTITGSNDLVSEVAILILENEDNQNRIVPREECHEIYVEEPITFAGAVSGSNAVSIDLTVTLDGTVNLVLTDTVTGQSYNMTPKRIGDEANTAGMEQASTTSLIN